MRQQVQEFPPTPGNVRCQGTRVIPMGGAFVNALQPKAYTPVQQLYRRLLPPSAYSASRTRPVTLELGAMAAPQSQVLVVAEFQMRAYGFSDNLDPVPLPFGSLSDSLGYDLNISNTRPGQVSYQMVPTEAPLRQALYRPLPTGGTVTSGMAISPMDMAKFGSVPNVYSEASVSAGSPKSSIDTAGAGDALMPTVIGHQQGPAKFPFTYYVSPSQALQLRAVVFGPIDIPIAFLEAQFEGFMIPKNALEALLAEMAPCQPVGPP